STLHLLKPYLSPYTTLFRSSKLRAGCPGSALMISTARSTSSASSSKVSACSTYTRARDNSAELTSKDGFSVVAPINVNRPLSTRSEEHTSELQSRENLVCRL